VALPTRSNPKQKKGRKRGPPPFHPNSIAARAAADPAEWARFKEWEQRMKYDLSLKLWQLERNDGARERRAPRSS
jgi:hypothetical protein